MTNARKTKFVFRAFVSKFDLHSVFMPDWGQRAVLNGTFCPTERSEPNGHIRKKPTVLLVKYRWLFSSV